jgi:DNA-binding SARP family transcriptional activator/predicted ATPase
VTGLRVAVLGQPRVEVDGAPLEVDTRKAVALLVYLATTDGASSREALATLLWPDSDRGRGLATLRRTLSSLNRALGGRWLHTDRANVSLVADGCWADVRAFRQALEPRPHDHPVPEPCSACLGDLEEAVGLYRDEFLAGFSLRDNEVFDDWQRQVADELRRQAASALDLIVAARTRRGELDEAAASAARRLELEPLHEPTHRQLVLLHAWRGRRADAIRQYERCRELLARDLGLDPLAETTALYEAVRAGRAPRPPVLRPGAGPVSGASARPPSPERSVARLVGRDDELQTLLSAHAAVRGSGCGTVIAVEGEVGIGKTTLLDAFADAVRRRGATVVSVHGREAERSLAYGVVADAVRGAAAGAELPDTVPGGWLAETARVVPELREAYPDLEPAPALDLPETRRRLLEGVRRTLLGGLVGPGTGVLVVDDAHWVDDASLDALLYVADRVEDADCCVAFAWDAAALPPGHRLRRLVVDLTRRGVGVQVTLPRLRPTAVAELVAADGHADPHGSFAERLLRETGGLPLLLTGFLRDLPPGGPDEDDEWRVPATARELLDARLEGLSDAARDLAVTAAVYARPLDLDALLGASDLRGTRAVAALEELLRAGILEEHLDVAPRTAPRYDFAMPALRSSVYEDASAARLRLVHGRVADALAQLADLVTPADLAAVAQHLRHAGRDREAAARFSEAAVAARKVVALDEAADHLRSALALGHDASGRLHETLGELETLRGDYPAALRAYRIAVEALTDPSDRPRLALRLAEIHQRRGDWAAAEQRLREALEQLPPGADALAARLHAELAVTAHRQGQRAAARELAGEALQLAEAAEDAQARAIARNTLGMVARADGDLDAAMAHLEHARQLAEELGDPAAAVAALNNLALTCADRGERPRALELAKTALARCRRGGDRHHEAALLNNLADQLHAAGRHEEARTHLEQAVTRFTEIGHPDRLEPEIWKLVDW